MTNRKRVAERRGPLPRDRVVDRALDDDGKTTTAFGAKSKESQPLRMTTFFRLAT
jgi:hypothetical protein